MAKTMKELKAEYLPIKPGKKPLEILPEDLEFLFTEYDEAFTWVNVNLAMQNSGNVNAVLANAQLIQDSLEIEVVKNDALDKDNKKLEKDNEQLKKENDDLKEEK